MCVLRRVAMAGYDIHIGDEVRPQLKLETKKKSRISSAKSFVKEKVAITRSTYAHMYTHMLSYQNEKLILS